LNNHQRGNAIVEFAFVLPVLIIFIAGIVDVGRYTYYSILISNAARAGAAYGAQTEITAHDIKGIESAVAADAGNASSLVSASPAPTFSCQDSSFKPVSCNSTSNRYEYVVVNARGTFNPLIKYPGLPGALTIQSTANMRVQCTQC
jgi:Flp pilus assembly protein TadG